MKRRMTRAKDRLSTTARARARGGPSSAFQAQVGSNENPKDSFGVELACQELVADLHARLTFLQALYDRAVYRSRTRQSS